MHKTLVIGGSGFLGSYIVESLLGAAHDVTVLTRNPESASKLLPRGVATVRGDLAELDSKSLRKLLAPFDKLVFAAGADERTRPVGDPRDFYFHENVTTCQMVLEAARACGITHAVVLNSIFTCINRLRPELELARHHPYIAARIAQSDMAIATSGDGFVVTVLEVPWVFGDSRGRDSQWAPIVHYARVGIPLVAPRGGALAISAKNIGAAVTGALAQPADADSASLPVGDGMLSWDSMLTQLARAAGRRQVKITRLPDRAFAAMNWTGALLLSVIGEKTGLDFARMHEFLLEQVEPDLGESRQRLGYSIASVEAALAETAASVPEPRIFKAWREIALNRDRAPALT